MIFFVVSSLGCFCDLLSPFKCDPRDQLRMEPVDWVATDCSLASLSSLAACQQQAYSRLKDLYTLRRGLSAAKTSFSLCPLSAYSQSQHSIPSCGRSRHDTLCLPIENCRTVAAGERIEGACSDAHNVASGFHHFTTILWLS